MKKNTSGGNGVATRVTASTEESPTSSTDGSRPPQQLPDFDFDSLLKGLTTILRPSTVAPTATPKTFLEQFRLYDSGGVRRFYVYVGGTWRYTVLT